ncbi:hypothetical protein GGS20DRAFT_234159 [Poronia punctata]|nr:hypothetical protein GGS20DRAFT_234159 [Poronia punctata]
MASTPAEPTYTVFIRLPFPRGDFIDPPPVNWDSSKDEALWSIISRLSKTEIDWNQIAAQFQVTVDFLLQQVAWLTERHASQVRAQMRKAAAAAKISPAPSPQPPNSDGPFPPDATRRVPTSPLVRRGSPFPRNETSTPRPPPTRTSSTNNQPFPARNLGGAAKLASRPSVDPTSRRLTTLPLTSGVDDQDDQDGQEYQDYQDYHRGAPQSPGLAEYSPTESSSSTASSSPAQSRIIRRPPRFQSNDGPYLADGYDDDEEVEPAFLPFATQPGSSDSGPHDLSATLRGNMRFSGKRLSKGSGRGRGHHSQTSDSSSGSTPVTRGPPEARPGDPSSPRRNTEPTVRSPSGKSRAYSRDSDGTPSMGSSFSDLDDASVTQSALEEAFASKMQDGSTISSLRGTISNAFRSRYQTRPNGNF